MATTTNYGWTTPDDTALVKDGAAAIRTLGTSVDTTTKNLNPSTTLGDIEYRSSSADTNTRLGIGTTGQILTVAGGVPSWASPATAGGFTLLSTSSCVGSNAVTVSSINQTYKHLFVEIEGITYINGPQALHIAPNSSDILNCVRTFISSSSLTQNVSDQSGNISGADWSLTNSNNYCQFWFYNYADTNRSKTMTGTGTFINSSANRASFTFSGGIITNSAISSIRFMIGASFNETMQTGTIRIYGVN